MTTSNNLRSVSHVLLLKWGVLKIECRMKNEKGNQDD